MTDFKIEEIPLDTNYTSFNPDNPGFIYYIKTFIKAFSIINKQPIPKLLFNLGFKLWNEDVTWYEYPEGEKTGLLYYSYRKVISEKEEIYQYVYFYPGTKRFTIKCCVEKQEYLNTLHPQYRLKEFNNIHIKNFKELKRYLKLITFDEKMR